jgi:hypothetical protein
MGNSIGVVGAGFRGHVSGRGILRFALLPLSVVAHACLADNEVIPLSMLDLTAIFVAANWDVRRFRVSWATIYIVAALPLAVVTEARL